MNKKLTIKIDREAENIAMLDRSKKIATENLKKYFESKKIVDKINKNKVDFINDNETKLIHLNQQEGYQQGFREAITIAVNLMFDKCYQDLEEKPFELIETILEDN